MSDIGHYISFHTILALPAIRILPSAIRLKLSPFCGTPGDIKGTHAKESPMDETSDPKQHHDGHPGQ